MSINQEEYNKLFDLYHKVLKTYSSYKHAAVQDNQYDSKLAFDTYQVYIQAHLDFELYLYELVE